MINELLIPIEAAYCWEGSAAARTTGENDTLINLEVRGSSGCEHTGDEDGIRQQVRELRGMEAKRDGIRYSIESATVAIQRPQFTGEDSYEVSVTGRVVIRKSKA